MYEPANLYRVLEDAASSRRGLLVYPPGNIEEPCLLAYHDLFVSAKQKARLLYNFAAAVKKPIILLHFDNHLDTIEWLWATVVAGFLPAISTPLVNDLSLRKKHLLHLNATLHGPLMLTTTRLKAEFLGIPGLKLHSTEELQHEYDNEIGVKRPDYSTKASEIETVFQGIHAESEDLAVLMLTSGSTGYAKAVCFRHGQMIKAVKGKSVHHGTSSESIFFNWIGMDHVANLTEIHLHATLLGADQVHVHAADLLLQPSAFVKLLSKHRVGYTFAPNFFLAALRKSLDTPAGSKLCDGADLSSLKSLISGGEASVVETCEALTKLLSYYGVEGDFIRPGFGMTETCAGSIYGRSCPSYELERRLDYGCLGSCIPGMSMRLVSDEGTVVAEGEIGHLQVRGSIVFQKYYNNPKATADAFTDDGWFITGDRGFLDENQYLNLSGRAKESITINGVQYYPHQIESALEQAYLPGVIPSYFACFPHRPPKSQTERFCIVYCPTYATTSIITRVETNDAIAKISATICGARPYQIIPLERSQLPKSALGKLSRTKIQKAFEAGAYQQIVQEHLCAIQAHKSSMRRNRILTETEKVVLSTFLDVLELDTDDLGVDSNMLDAGITSIDLLRMQKVLQAKFAIAEIPLITLLMNPTIEGMSAVIDQLKGTTSDKVAAYNPVIPLSTKGSKTPLWLVHPGVGEVLVFLNLAKFVTERPVYALRAKGFEQGEHFFDSIPQIVETYHEHILRTQPEGPYAIAGYSFGAMLAFEISKCLEVQGKQVKFLGSFNLPPHIKTRMNQLDWIEVALNLGYFLDFYSEIYQQRISDEMHLKQPQEVLSFIMETAPPNRLAELSLTRPKLERWISLAHAMQNAARNYEPSGSVAHIDVFYCTPLASVSKDRHQWLKEFLSKWADFSREEPHFHEVGGAHYTMLDSVNVHSFQKKLKAVLRQRGL
ncbi:hypothetical protein BDR22DRAFT_804970 [Usnea florida]